MLKDILVRLRKCSSPRQGATRIVFLHLPRTGGTALAKDILLPNFPRSRWCHVNYSRDLRPQAGADDPIQWSEVKRRRMRLLAGHMPIELAHRFPGPSEFVTMLRDPVARTVSDYYFCRRSPANPAHEMARNLSLVQFVERGYGLTHNCYTRWLSNASYGTQFSTEDEMLQSARRNLASFVLVGITEWFEISVLRICERYRLTQGTLSTENRNGATPQGTDISAKERRVIMQYNELDYVIYADARDQFRKDTPGKSLDRAGTDTLERPAYT